MKINLEHTTQIRPRYGEVDQMGYVYHSNYVTYCHQARTELLRKINIDDKTLETSQIMLPVISMSLKYHKAAGYDEPLFVHTTISEVPTTRFSFHFEFRNAKDDLVCKADSTVVFVDSVTRKPMKAPKLVIDAIENFLKANSSHETHYSH